MEIDGSDGGQILRTSIALAAIKKIPCRIFNIRKSRPKPGLQPQHLVSIQNVAKLCGGFLEGDIIGSDEIKFYPAEISAKDLYIKIETAGSITLCVQSLLPVILFAEKPIKISFEGGGTDVPFSPTIDHFRYVFLKILENMGAKVNLEILKRGYFPAGGAQIEAKILKEVSGVGLKPLHLINRGKFEKISVISGACKSLSEKKVAERQTAGVREILGKLKLPIEERIEYYDTNSPGSQICLIAEFENTRIGTDNLGKLGQRAEDVGREAALQLLKEQKSEACLDKYLADQILPYLALASGESQVKVSEITPHLKTNILVIEKFIQGKFEIKNNLIVWLPHQKTK